MPYTTPLPGGFIDINLATPVLTLPPTFVLNDLGTSEAFDLYDVDANGATTLSIGDPLTLVDGDGDPVSGGYFAGMGTLSTAASSINVAFLASVSIQVNSISGPIYVDEFGNPSMITDDELSSSRLGVTLIIDPLIGPNIVLDLPIEEIASSLPLGLGALLTPITNRIQLILDTAIVTYTYDPNATWILGESQVVPCFLRGTLIDTPNGMVPIESLRAGDLVRTRDHGDQPIRWRGAVILSGQRLQAQPHLRPIRIAAGALGDGCPERSLVVSPQHRMLVRSRIAQRMFDAREVLVAAKQLLSLPGVEVADDLRCVEYHHLLLDRHEIIFANGAETESLFTGPQALKGLGPAARDEIFALFPELASGSALPVATRELSSGRMGRKLAQRHAKNGLPLVSRH